MKFRIEVKQATYCGEPVNILTEAPQVGKTYWVISHFGEAFKLRWDDFDFERQALADGLLYADEESARKVAEIRKGHVGK